MKEVETVLKKSSTNYNLNSPPAHEKKYIDFPVASLPLVSKEEKTLAYIDSKSYRSKLANETSK